MQLQGSLAGRLVKAPEMYFSQDGKPYAKLVLPSDVYDRRLGKGKATWVNVTIFGARAEFCEKNLEKGSVVWIQGPIDVREYVTKDGRSGVSVDMIADKLEPLASFGDKYVYDTGKPTNTQPVEEFDPSEPF